DALPTQTPAQVGWRKWGVKSFLVNTNIAGVISEQQISNMEPSPPTFCKSQPSRLPLWLGIAVNLLSFLCEIGSCLARSKEGAVLFLSVIFVVAPITLFAALLLILTRDRARPFPWVIAGLGIAPLPIWLFTMEVVGFLRRFAL